MITGYFITTEQYFNKNKSVSEEIKVFLSAFRLLSKVKAAKHASQRWCLSSDIPTGKYEKIDRANKFYKSELGLPIIPTSTERSIKPLQIFSLMLISTGKQEKLKVDQNYMNLTTHECTRNVILVEGDPTCGGGGGG